jgi:hypothetical protein
VRGVGSMMWVSIFRVEAEIDGRGSLVKSSFR